MPACSIMTPLGFPVEPEVKITYARSPGRAGIVNGM